MQADSIKIECEEDGFHLVIDGDDPTGEYQAAEFNFNIHSCAEALHEQVNLIIGGWLAEGEQARRAEIGFVRPAPNPDNDFGLFQATFRCNPDESGGYAASDPKHPAFHSVHADLYDSRSEK